IYKCAGAVSQGRESHRRNCFYNVPQTLFLTPELTNAPSMECPEQRNQGCQARQPEPVSLIVSRSDGEIERRARFVPYAAVIARLHADGVIARRKVAVERLPASASVLPILIPAFRLVAK